MEGLGLCLSFHHRFYRCASESTNRRAQFIKLIYSRWTTRLNEDDLHYAIQHLQSIEVQAVAEKEKAHTVANRIHNLILRSFISGIPGADHDEQMVEMEDEEEEEEDIESAEGADEDGTENEEMFDKDERASVNNGSAYSNATSVSTSLSKSDQSIYPRQEYPSYPPPMEVGTGQQITTDWPIHPSYLASTSLYTQTNGIYPSCRISDIKLIEK